MKNDVENNTEFNTKVNTKVNKKFDILIAGVGGQGVVLASRLLALTAMKAGFRVSTAETIGMSQREGSVSSHVRIGEDVKGSLIPLGEADLILGLEPSETVRNLPFLKKGGRVLVNTHAVFPASKPEGSPEYDPLALLSFLREACPGSGCFDFTKLAGEAGTSRAANVAMLGSAAAADLLPFSADELRKVLEAEIPEKYLEVNRKTFELASEKARLIQVKR